MILNDLVDYRNCSKCYKCVEVCPLQIIKHKHNSYPYKIKSELCINCSHCTFYCSAWSLGDELNMSKIEKPTNGICDLEDLISIRSTRVFIKKDVSPKLINKIIEYCSFAPSGFNKDSIKWVVINDKDVINEIFVLVRKWIVSRIQEKSDLVEELHLNHILEVINEEKIPFALKAPNIVFTYSKIKDLTRRPANIIALTYFNIIANRYKLGTCWNGYIHLIAKFAPLKAFLAIPEDCECCGVVMFGYPKYKSAKLPTKRKPNIKYLV